MRILKKYIREPVNGLTHLFGAFFSVVGLYLLLQVSLKHGNPYHIFAFTVFGISSFILYLVSSLYHSLPVKEQLIKFLQRLDHSAIYLKIAGSYTPICLIVLDGEMKWMVFAAVWSFALLGIIKKFTWKDAPNWITITLYLIMGWLGAFLFPVLYEKLPSAFMYWLLMGGLAYTVGVVFLAVKKPNPIPGWFGHHEIWHLFVLAGTFSHFVAFYQYLTLYGV